MKRRRRLPTLRQWEIIRTLVDNGWGEGDFAVDKADRREKLKAISALEDWLESRFQIEFKYRLTNTTKQLATSHSTKSKTLARLQRP